jgi:hypothetical protein
MPRRPEYPVPERNRICLRSVGRKKIYGNSLICASRKRKPGADIVNQNGFTTARMTIRISKTVGISLMIL